MKKITLILACVFFCALVGCTKQPTKQEAQLRAQEIFDALQKEDIKSVYDTYGSKQWKEKVDVNGFKEDIYPRDADTITSFEFESITEATEDRMIVDGQVAYPTFTKDLRMIFTNKLTIDSLEIHNPVARLDFPETIIEEDITIGEDTDFPLKGKVTLPKDAEGNIPGVILVHGSGAADYDESAYAYKPFRDIAWGLAERGIASIRYDKRTYVYGNDAFSAGIKKMNVQEETIDDALRAVDELLSDERIDSENIYVIGHSLGGMLGPRIAQENSHVAGIVSLAGSPRSFSEIMFDQQQMLLNAQSLPKSVREQQLEEIEAMHEEMEAILALPEDELIAEEVLGLPAYYLWEMEQHPVKEIIPSLDIPIYIMQGDEDFQVFKETDYPAWKKVLADKEEVTFSSYPNLNHFFIEHDEKAASLQEAYDKPGIVSEEVIDDIATWVHEQ